MRQKLSTITTGLFVVTSLVVSASAQTSESTRYEPDLSASRLTVDGTSTVHDWTLESQVVRGELIVHDIDATALGTSGRTFPQPLSATVRVEILVDSLKSDNSGLNRRMYEALKADSHPMITYRLERAELQAGQAADEDGSEGSLLVATSGVLTVAGVDRTMDIPMQVARLPADGLRVSGETSLRMTEFGIEPPRVMLGFLRTGDTVKVRWTWVLVPRRNDGPDER